MRTAFSGPCGSITRLGTIAAPRPAAPPGQHRRLHGAPCPAALRLRLLDRDTVEQTRGVVQDSENRFVVRSQSLAADPLARARLALELGLAGKALAAARSGRRLNASPNELNSSSGSVSTVSQDGKSRRQPPSGSCTGAP